MESEMRKLEITVTNPMSRFEIRFPYRIPLPPFQSRSKLAFPNTKKNSNEAVCDLITLMYRWDGILKRVAPCSSNYQSIIRRARYANGVDRCAKRANVYAPDSPGREARWIGARELRKPRIPGKLELLPVDSPR